MDEIKLAEKFNSDGFELALVERDGDYAIYSQSKYGRIVSYEAVRIRHTPGKIFPGGKARQAAESYPKPSDWGKTAFSCMTVERARKRIEIMRQSMRKSILSNQEGADTLGGTE